jgi:tetratricopeptide (TPR) repeat protein
MILPAVLGTSLSALTLAALLSTDPVTVRRFSVPLGVEYSGYQGELIAKLLRERIRTIASEASTARGEVLSVIDRDHSAVETMAERLQLAGLVDAVQEFFNLQTYQVSGYVVFSGRDLKLGIKVETANDDLFFLSAQGGQDVAALINEVAERFVERVDPYLLALYWFRKEYPGGEFTRSQPLIEHSLDVLPLAQKQWPLLLLGRIAYREGDYARAIAHYQDALRFAPTFAYPVARWGEALIASGESAAGLDKLRLATGLPSSTAVLQRLYADSLRGLGHDDEARDAFVAGLERYPNDPGLQIGLAQLYLAYGLHAPALALLERAVLNSTPDAALHESITEAARGLLAERGLPTYITSQSGWSEQ